MHEQTVASWLAAYNRLAASSLSVHVLFYNGCVVYRGATPQDHRILPRRIILVRHAESEGNIDNFAYTYVPDPQVPLVGNL